MLKGKTAVVTGASRGIGRAIALKMAENGANIALIYAGNNQGAQAVCEEISSLGVTATAYQCDVSNFEATKQTIGNILEAFGSIDILVNNAGITADKLVLQMSQQDFERVVDTNLKGAFNMIKHTYSHFMKKRGGRIINISSVAGIMGNAGQANYASAKAGMIGLTKSVAKELAARSVTCNAIAPGFIETDMTNVLSDRVKEGAVAAIPMKRMGKPEDIANMAVFLASDLCEYITGEVIKVDGGLCI